MKKELRIPTILGLFILALTTFGIGGYVIKNTVNTQSKADESCVPSEINVSNLSANSVDVFFVTKNSCQISLKIADNIFSDVRSSLSDPVKRKNHYFQVNNLVQASEYKVQLLINGENMATEKTFRTQAVRGEKNDGSNFAWGRVFTASTSQPAQGSILHIDIPGYQKISGFVSDAGNWFIPNSLVYDRNGKQSLLSENIQENIQIIDKDGKNYTFGNSTNNNQPVPDIFITKDNFKIPQFNQQTSPKTASGNLDTQPTVVSQNTSKLEIKYPKQNETIPSRKPEFFGTSQASTSLNISLTGTSNQTATIVSGLDGTWKWSPSSALSLGNYVLKISSSQAEVQSSFSITQDQGLAFVSTPSASIITPTSPPKPTIIITPTLVPTTTDKKTTSTPIPQPTKAILMESGGVLETASLVVVGLLVTGVGIFFTR